MHWQYRTICRGQNSILHNLYEVLGSKVHDYISFFGLRAYGKLFDGGPVATSQVYIYVFPSWLCLTCFVVLDGIHGGIHLFATI